jgi:D-glycero-D-manno-heptose 1,7-bisphosphate phosphatase
MRRAVFLDRDGVINRAVVRNGRPYPPDTLEDFALLPGVPDALARLKAAGFLLVVVTNQPDVASGKQRRSIVDSFHAKLMAELPLDTIKACFELDSPESIHYKPKPGMLLEAAGELDIDLAGSFMVGDRWRDVGAGKNAGCVTLFIDYRYEEQRPDSPDHVVASLAEAADVILSS